METKLVLALLLPVISLILVLCWAYLVLSHRRAVTFNLSGFGVKLELRSGAHALKESENEV